MNYAMSTSCLQNTRSLGEMSILFGSSLHTVAYICGSLITTNSKLRGTAHITPARGVFRTMRAVRIGTREPI